MIYAFDDYELDTRLHELRHAGKPFALEPQVFKVLVYLVQHRDHAVSKAELFAHLWPDEFVQDWALVRCVVKARQAVGDTGRTQQYIKTVTGYGYRFTATNLVERDTAVAPPTPPPPQEDAPRPLVLPFVGRAQELATLHAVLERVEAGQGQTVYVVGRPGIGKSRLLHEFRQQLHGRPITYLAARCYASGSPRPTAPLRTLLRQYCGLAVTDNATTCTTHVRQRLQQLGMDQEADVAVLLHLLGVETGTQALAALSPELATFRIAETLCRLFLHGSRQQPLLVAIDDLHCLEPTSAAYLAPVLEVLATAPLCLLMTHPPTYQPTWPETTAITRLVLPPLTPRDSLQVVHATLPLETLSDALAQTMVNKAAGQPLFLEQMARAVLEHEAPWSDMPDTIQDVLAARMAHLPEALRRLIDLAAVLGQTFAVRVLEALWQGPESPAAALRTLHQRGWCSPLQDTAEPAYGFAHALLQDVVYTGIPAARRQALHLATAQQLEPFSATYADEGAASLAAHYTRTTQAEQAIIALRHQACLAAQRFAHAEARTALYEALAQSQRPPITLERKRLSLALHVELAQTLLSQECYTEALELLTPPPARLAVSAAPTLAGRWSLLLSQAYSGLGQWPQATENARHAIEQATQHSDTATVGRASYILAMACYVAEQPGPGIAHGQQAVAALAQSQERYRLGLAQVVLSLHYLTHGDFDAALDMAAQGEAIGEAIHDPQLQAFAAWTAGWIEATRGAWEKGITACQRSIAHAPDLLSRALALGALGYAHIEQGAPGQAIPLLEQAVTTCRQVQQRRSESLLTTWLGEAALLQGQFDAAHDYARQGLASAQELHYRTGTAWAQRVLGRTALARKALTTAGQHLHEALATFTTIPARFEIGRTHLVLLELAQYQGDLQAAALHATEATRLFRTLQAAGYVVRTEQQAHALGLR
jgi:DNA-binding winged helix-turn-helix (wHTH) protein/tetratricopeptide (TPR) repeat protein